MSDEEDKQIWLLCVVLVALVVAVCVIANVWAMDEPPEPVEMCLYQTSPYLDEEEIEFNKLIDRVILCESGGRIDAQNPTSSAFGLCQYLDGTWKYVEQKWNMELDRYSYDDQLYACRRLMKEEGCRHWRESAPCHGCYE